MVQLDAHQLHNLRQGFNLLKSEDYQGVRKTVYPPRGTIYDRSGHILATNQIGYELGIDLKFVSDPEVQSLLLPPASWKTWTTVRFSRSQVRRRENQRKIGISSSRAMSVKKGSRAGTAPRRTIPSAARRLGLPNPIFNGLDLDTNAAAYLSGRHTGGQRAWILQHIFHAKPPRVCMVWKKPTTGF